MRKLMTIAGIAALGLLAAQRIAAQTKAPDSAAMMPCMADMKMPAKMPMYDVKTVTTVKGEIAKIDTMPCVGMGMGASMSMGAGMGAGVHLTLKAGKETIAVHLGPAMYLAKQSMKLKVGDQIAVNGSRMDMNNAPTIMAAKITRGKETMVLRDAEGRPVWMGKKMMTKKE